MPGGMPGTSQSAVQGPAATAPPPPAVTAASLRQAALDMRSSLLAASVWGATAARMAPLVSASASTQTAAGLAALLAMSAWPALRPRSYIRWRTPALVALKLALFLLPLNYDVATFDAMAPGPATGRWAWAANFSILLNGTHTLDLLFSALLWRLPLGPHLAVQTTEVGLLVAFGVHPHCQSRLLSSSQVQALAAGFVGWGSLATAVMVPTASMFLVLPGAPTSGLVLGDPYRQTAAALIFSWIFLGWLVPTLLVLPKHDHLAEHAQHQPARQGQQHGALGATAARIDRWLRTLLPEPAAAGGHCSILQLVLRWLPIANTAFQASCSIAQLYSVPLL